jgi:hypothetical protein
MSGLRAISFLYQSKTVEYDQGMSHGIASRIVAELRKKHQVDSGPSANPSPRFRSTCGLVVDGDKINFVVPGMAFAIQWFLWLFMSPNRLEKTFLQGVRHASKSLFCSVWW